MTLEDFLQRKIEYHKAQKDIHEKEIKELEAELEKVRGK